MAAALPAYLAFSPKRKFLAELKPCIFASADFAATVRRKLFFLTDFLRVRFLEALLFFDVFREDPFVQDRRLWPLTPHAPHLYFIPTL